MEELIGKVFLVKITRKIDNWFVATIIDKNQLVYIEDNGDYDEDELINTIEKCVITDVRENHLIGFILSNRKFINTMHKINNKLRNSKEYFNVKDIYLIQRLKIKGKVLGLYLVDEGEISKLYIGTIEICTIVNKMMGNNILFKENTLENQLGAQIKDIVQSADLNKKEMSLRQEQEKEKKLIEKALGLERTNEITRIVTLDLKQKVKEENEKQNEKVINENQKQNQTEIKKENTIKDVNIKQEMDTKDKVTDMKTLGQIIEKSGKMPDMEDAKFTKIGIIESVERDNLVNAKGEKEKTNTTRYSFIAITNDNKVVPLDLELDNTAGINSKEQNYQISQKGEVKKDDVTSRYKLGEGTISVKNGEYGELKVYHSPRKTIGGKGVEGNQNLDRELETNNVWEIKKDERDLAEEFGDGYRSVEEGYQEAEKHGKDGKVEEGDLKIEDIDGDKNTKSHIHDDVDYSKLAIKWGYYKDGEPNDAKAQKLFEEKRKENPDKETKEIVEMVTEDLEEEISGSRDRR